MERIKRLLPYVSWYPSNAAVSELPEQHLQCLHQAWALRKNCPYKALQQSGSIVVEGGDLGVGAPDWSKIGAAKNAPTIDTAEGLYVLRANAQRSSPINGKKTVCQVHLAALRHGHITRRQQELEDSGTAESTCLHDHDDPNDLRFMLALQDACLERYAQRGLSIEVNPSSNVYIGQLQTHSDHPIYRWNPPNGSLAEGTPFNLFGLRKTLMPVTINTDDPGMIPTTLRMEHHLMHEAAIDRGHTETEVNDWIEKLRQYGLTQFEAAHK